jgi:hypothetical protein
MDKKTVNDILWSLNYVHNYVKTYGKEDIKSYRRTGGFDIHCSTGA